ncbi:MAG TPA: asparagine synthase (glutamine-hydrolyzing) [Thermoanaerobaculia bacterium]|jgi:asparagine synthase (glutamine-hydrolysing)|nr:asparagine synthase (glutamine-hydrolyzing) [Thermoanaerobaculia bacterium]
MCGIAGFFLYGERGSVSREALAAMVAPLAHRGPDDQGTHLFGPLGLAHARLSIIDVAGGHQPIFNEDRSVAVVCNGEIYNHRELRRGLEDRGHRFATRSDSEVAVHLWEEMGPRCVEKLAGMFALAVADFRNRRLLLARDRIGKKPLFISDDGRRLGFASELKSLLAAGLAGPEINPEALDLYLSYGYVPAPWTIFRGAAKLPAGHLAMIDERGMRIERYWDMPADPVHDLGPEADERLTGELEALLASAVRDRLESEVPLGAFLSGGIDSGTIVSFMSEAMATAVRTHTVGFADRATDEREDAAAVARALGTDHVENEVRPDLVDVLPRIAWHLDEPFADPSAVPTWYVSRETRRRVTVALSGDGGDELFAGYGEKYGMHLLEERLRPWVPAGVRRGLFPPLARRWPRSPRLPRALRLGGLFANLSVDAARSYYQDRCLIPLHLQERLFGADLKERRRRFDPFAAVEPHLARAPKEPLARALYLDLKTWLADDGLVKVDRMSMAHALEVRCPLLDHRIVELAARLPARLKLAGGKTKILLRRVAERRLPAEILSRPKRGFAPPVSRWLREDLRDLSRDLLLAPDAFGGGLFERREVERLLDDHESRRLEAGWALWTLLMLEVWGREVARKAVSEIDLEVPRAAAG